MPTANHAQSRCPHSCSPQLRWPRLCYRKQLQQLQQLAVNSYTSSTQRRGAERHQQRTIAPPAWARSGHHPESSDARSSGAPITRLPQRSSEENLPPLRTSSVCLHGSIASCRSTPILTGSTDARVERSAAISGVTSAAAADYSTTWTVNGGIPERDRTCPSYLLVTRVYFSVGTKQSEQFAWSCP